jgi:hypothetical protein
MQKVEKERQDTFLEEEGRTERVTRDTIAILPSWSCVVVEICVVALAGLLQQYCEIRKSHSDNHIFIMPLRSG